MKLKSLALFLVGLAGACAPLESGLLDGPNNNIINIQSSNIQDVFNVVNTEQHKGKKVVVVVGASYCHFCHKLKPIANSFAAKNPNVVVVHVDYGQAKLNPDLESSILGYMKKQYTASGLNYTVKKNGVNQPLTPNFAGGIPQVLMLEAANINGTRALSFDAANRSAKILVPGILPSAVQGQQPAYMKEIYAFEGFNPNAAYDSNKQQFLSLSMMEGWIDAGRSSFAPSSLAAQPAATGQSIKIHSVSAQAIRYNVCGTTCSAPINVSVADFQNLVATSGHDVEFMDFVTDDMKRQAGQLGIVSTGTGH